MLGGHTQISLTAKFKHLIQGSHSQADSSSSFNGQALGVIGFPPSLSLARLLKDASGLMFLI